MVSMPNVLLVDDDARLLKAAQRNFRNDFNLKTALNADDAQQIVEMAQQPFDVIISDQQMPGTSGTDFLSRIAELSPNTTRVMMTGSPDLPTMSDAINQGRVFRFITKPCDPGILREVVMEAFSYSKKKNVKQALLQSSLKGGMQVILEMAASSCPSAAKRAKLITTWMQKLCATIGMHNNHDLIAAASLSTVGLSVLPAHISSKYLKSELLDVDEITLVAESYIHGAQLIQNIPKTDNIVTAIKYCRRRYDGSGLPSDGPTGEDIPLYARMLGVLLDLAYEQVASGGTLMELTSTLRQKKGRYDPKIIAVVEEALKDDESFAKEVTMVDLQVAPVRLQSGDVLKNALFDCFGKIIFQEGEALTNKKITHLCSYERLNRFVGNVSVCRAQQHAAL